MAKKLALIGFGAANLCVLTQLNKHLKYNEIEIDIYSPLTGWGGRFIRGLAYQEDIDKLLLNHHHKYMSIDLDAPDDFSYLWNKS